MVRLLAVLILVFQIPVWGISVQELPSCGDEVSQSCCGDNCAERDSGCLCCLTHADREGFDAEPLLYPGASSQEALHRPEASGILPAETLFPRLSRDPADWRTPRSTAPPRPLLASWTI
jgi:hypothetical protein